MTEGYKLVEPTAFRVTTKTGQGMYEEGTPQSRLDNWRKYGWKVEPLYLAAAPEPLRLSEEAAAKAIADGFSNGYEPYDAASPTMQLRFDMAARSVLALIDMPRNEDQGSYSGSPTSRRGSLTTGQGGEP